jgi:hypothetical protein
MGTMTEFVKVLYGDKEYQLPLVVGTEGEKAIDISRAVGRAFVIY